MSATSYDRSWERIEKGLRRQQRAGGSYSYESTLYFDGKPDRMTRDDITSKREAEQWHRKRKYDLDLGKKPARRDVTVEQLKEEAFAYYWKEIARDEGEATGVGEGVLAEYERAFKLRISKHRIYRMRLNKIDGEAARGFLKWLLTLQRTDENPDGLASNTLNQTFSALRLVLRYAREEEYMTVDPFSGVPRRLRPPQKPMKESEKKALTPPEMKALVLAASTPEFVEATDTLFENAVIANALEGGRASETCGYRWKDVDLDEGVLMTRVQRAASGRRSLEDDGRRTARTKNRKQRVQVMQAWTVAALKRQLVHERSKGLGRPDDFVFTLADGQGEAIDRHALRRAVERAGRIAGLDHVHPQRLRMSTSSAAGHAGVSDLNNAARLGHSVEVSRKNYQREYGDLTSLREDAEKVAAHLDLDGPVQKPVQSPSAKIIAFPKRTRKAS